MASKDYGKPFLPYFWKETTHFPLTQAVFCAIFTLLKAAKKTYASGKIPREEPFAEKALYPCRCRTASELIGGNASPDCIRYHMRNEWRLVRNQGGTVEYYYNMYPTPDYVRGGVFVF